MDTAASTACAQIDPRAVSELEAEITTLAAHLNAASYRFLVLSADFDRREGWGGFGIRSCAHWLNWKCGLGLTAAREKAPRRPCPASAAADLRGDAAQPAKRSIQLAFALSKTHVHRARISRRRRADMRLRRLLYCRQPR